MFRFISEDLKLLIEGLELKKWDRHGKLIAGCSDIFKDISYYLKLYDSELDSEIVKKTNLNKIIEELKNRITNIKQRKGLDIVDIPGHSGERVLIS